MASHKYIDGICWGIVVLTLAVTLLFMNGKALGLTAVAPEGEDEMFTANDLTADYDRSAATRIILSAESAQVQGNGAYFYQGDVYIVSPGKYVLSGALDDGSVIVQAEGDDKIWLYMDGVDLSCQDGAALDVEQAGKVFLTLGDGTVNRLSSGESYSQEAVSAGIDGTVYSRDDLTIQGSGQLTVEGTYCHGIVCNDDLVITGGRLDIQAAQDGIHANDSVRVREADIAIRAGDDGVTAQNDEGTGFFYMESGSLAVSECYEGVEAVCVTIAGGTLDLAPTDDGVNATGTGEAGYIRVSGGEIRIRNATGRDADGLDSNGSIYLEGGSVFISLNGQGGNLAIDYGSEYGGVCRIDGGTILACGSNTMAEAISADSSQGFLMESVTGQAGCQVTLEAGGQTLLTEEVPNEFTCLIVSAPGLRVGDSCTLTVGESQQTYTVDNSSDAVSAFGQMGGRFGGFGGGVQQPEGEAPSGGEAPAGMEPPSGGLGEAPGLPEGTVPQDGGGQRPQRGPSLEGEDSGAQNPNGGVEGRWPAFGGGRGDFQGQLPEGDGQLPGMGQLQTEGEAPVSMETIRTEALLVGVSALVLGIGLAVALCFRRR